MKKSLLKQINLPKDLRLLNQEDLPHLAKELRDFIINIVATKEGHLGASLGVVELTIALHYVFNTPIDALIWDVGHQAYGHKILTGRKEIFDTNRQLNGISGFPKRSESAYDAFGVGHSSTSISAALGMAIASQLKGEDKHHIAVIGDASIASGMAFEGLNHAGVTNANLLVILNDNAIGIDPSVGALKQYLTNVKKGTEKQDNIFEALNFNYSGPIDGHDLPTLISELKRLKTIKGPKFLHIITTKGKGLRQAEENQVKYHAPGKFDAKTGELVTKNNIGQEAPKYQDVFGETIVELALKNKKIVGITPAMPTGSSLKYMMDTIPERAFDVGIAEQHAVTLAAGMATQGLIPFCNIYSTFLQRAYDQVIHDVALQKLPVVFCLDRAGLVGEDGATHHGVFDIAYLNCIPNLVIFAPSNAIALRQIMYTVQLGIDVPIAIRYPRGRGHIIDWKTPFEKIEIGKGICINKGEQIAVLSVGTVAFKIKNAIASLDKKFNVGQYDMQFIKPLDTSLLHDIFQHYHAIITVEDGTIIGGFGSSVLAFANTHNYKHNIITLGIDDQFVEHGTTDELNQLQHLDELSIKKEIENLFLTVNNGHV
ncbi:1-deoxy-D-xylulose-5-phosphate synthase [Winogradskyella eckloniae]|uniref:1-deoxy-D-xylulose-5-phosphate synthase n=1 Tax=Winogradskyella eckloniae TaxID=1089306 RepID=UPI0015654169|nr:1-deoxy-D-xylulose-5-phosphate synthase [Winogradskyella eckloniae]NRD18899.1 1-deoxy-D-xylulose-5-phosphate synthase [Winogradskyella eckloniae]